jgi:hypothetical protein
MVSRCGDSRADLTQMAPRLWSYSIFWVDRTEENPDGELLANFLRVGFVLDWTPMI